jgi:predicted RND superfamily exporter protein
MACSRSTSSSASSRTGKTSDEAARDSFTGLLIPGTLALVTAFVSFITLILIPIPMVRELAITASLGVATRSSPTW